MQAEREGEYVEFVTARLATLRRFAFLLCGDEHRADDLVQQTITKLYERWRRARSVGNLDQYVRTMLLRVFLDERRLAWSSRVSLTGAPPERPAPNGPDLAQRAVLRSALARVPRRQQAVLVLRFLCDLPVDEVARLLGCSAGWNAAGWVVGNTEDGLTLVAGSRLVELPYPKLPVDPDDRFGNLPVVRLVSDDARTIAGQVFTEDSFLAVAWRCR